MCGHNNVVMWTYNILEFSLKKQIHKRKDLKMCFIPKQLKWSQKMHKM